MYAYFYTNSARSQVVDAANCKGEKCHFITRYVKVFKSKINLPLDSILYSDLVQFKNIENKKVIFSGYDQCYYWFRFSVRNVDTMPKKLALLLGPIGVKDAELFQSQKAKWISLGKTGMKYPFIERPYQHAHYAFPITIPASSLDTFYLSMDFGHEFRSYAFVLMEQKALKKFENEFYMFFGIIIGLLSLFFALNLYLYVSIKEKIHLWYAVYIMMLIFIVMVNDELAGQFLGFDSEKAYKMTPLSALAGIAIAVLIYVVQLFLLNVSKEGLLFKAALFMRWNLLLSAVGHFLAFNFQPGIPIEALVFSWVNYSTIAGIILIFANCLYSVYNGFKGALFILIGLSVFFVGSMERLLMLSTPSYVFPPNLFHIGMIVETAIISFALIYRHRQERKEKFKYLLEKEQFKVTYEKRILQGKLEVQENTFKYISQEIHDNIGQVLSLAKLNISSIGSPTSGDFNHKVSESKELLNKVLKDLNDLSGSMHSKIIVEIGLLKSLENELDLIGKTSIYHTQMITNGQPFRFDHHKEMEIFRICQEALHNILKHSDANEIIIRIHFESAALLLEIGDNGKGFSSMINYGLGIRNMESRSKLIGADLKIDGGSGGGTTVTISLPVKPF